MEKILIIEDDKDYIENIRLLLEEEGYSVLTAVNGMDGIDIAKNEMPSLIICDIMLPDIDGYSVLSELRKREKTSLLPLIFLTAKAEMSDLRIGMNIGADDYITKPFHADDLLTAIKIRLKKAQLIKDSSGGTRNTSRLGVDDYLFLPARNNYEVLPVNNVLCIAAEGVYTNVFTIDGRKVLIRKLLKEWEETLPKSIFLRIHKSFLVNIHYIKKIDKWFNGSLKIHLKNYNDSLIVSRRYASKLKKNF